MEEDKQIIDEITENPFLTATEIARGHNVTHQTISNRLKENGIKCYVSAKQTDLTEDQRIQRYVFVKNLMEKYDQQHFNNIIFSDEKTFQSDVNRETLVYRPPKSRYDPKYVSNYRLSGRISASYWGAIGIDGPVTDLVRVDGHLNSIQYLDMLANHLVPTMNTFNNERIFMQDNSPIHTSNVVMDYLSQQHFGVMGWCPFSPDLNPIENVWAEMTRDWPKLVNRTQFALNNIIQARWTGLRNDSEYFQNLYKSLPKRCQEVITSEGNWCSY